MGAGGSQCVWYTLNSEPLRKLTRTNAGSDEAAGRVSRIPSGHPEGNLEAFATIYSEAAHAIRVRQAGAELPVGVIYPDVMDGLAGVAFVGACVRSSNCGGHWVRPSV